MHTNPLLFYLVMMDEKINPIHIVYKATPPPHPALKVLPKSTNLRIFSLYKLNMKLALSTNTESRLGHATGPAHVRPNFGSPAFP